MMPKLAPAFQRRRLFRAALPLELAALMSDLTCNDSLMYTANGYVLMETRTNF